LQGASESKLDPLDMSEVFAILYPVIRLRHFDFASVVGYIFLARIRVHGPPRNL